LASILLTLKDTQLKGSPFDLGMLYNLQGLVIINLTGLPRQERENNALKSFEVAGRCFEESHYQMSYRPGEEVA
jgi:hypothetical protein